MTFLGVGEWLARRAELTPAKIGLVDGEMGARYTWRTLDLRARALATTLHGRHGVSQGDRVAILALNAPEYLDALYACGLLGAILVPLNWRLTPNELTMLLGDSAPRVVLCDERYAETARMVAARQPSAMATLPFADFPGADEALAARAVPFTTADGEEPLLLLYTSGTTGVAKGALLSHRMLTWNAVNTQISWGLRDDDITPTFAPLFHAGGLNVLTTPLYHLGGTVVLQRDTSPAETLRVIAAERCTVAFAVPNIEAGKVVALGTSAARPTTLVANVQPIAVAVPGYDWQAWQGIVAPAGTPKEIVARLSAELQKIQATPEFRAQLTKFGMEPFPPTTPEQFAAMIASEQPVWAKAIKESGAKVD